MANASTSNPWFGISIGLVGLIVGYGLASGMSGGFPLRPDGGTVPQAANGGQQPTVPTPPPTTDTPPSVDDDPVIGDKNAKITVVEFTDYQCPFCKRHFDQTYSQIKTNYIDTGKVKYVTRDYPLGFHPNAQKASEASECAEDQGKFWEMHDMLFAKQAEWSPLSPAVDTFKKYAGDLKLNTATFNDCLDSGKYADEVKKDLADGSAAGIDGTPGFWILGPGGKNQKISGAYPYDTFKTAFDNLLQ